MRFPTGTVARRSVSLGRFLNPLLMLTVYTFVFSVIFKARWGGGGAEESRVDFAITLFAGLIVFNLFAEIMNKAPTLILTNVNYVKKVIFLWKFFPWSRLVLFFFTASSACWC